MKKHVIIWILVGILIFFIIPLILLFFVIKPYILLSPSLEVKMDNFKINLQNYGEPVSLPNFNNTQNTPTLFCLKSLVPSVEEQIGKQQDEAGRWNGLFDRNFSFVRHNISVENKLVAKIESYNFPTKISCEDEISYKSVKLEGKSKEIEEKFTSCMNKPIALYNNTKQTVSLSRSSDILISGMVVVKFSPDTKSLVIGYILSVLIWSGFILFLRSTFLSFVIKKWKFFIDS